MDDRESTSTLRTSPRISVNKHSTLTVSRGEEEFHPSQDTPSTQGNKKSTLKRDWHMLLALLLGID